MWEIINNSLSAITLASSVLIFGKIVLNDSNKIITRKNLILSLLICIIQTIIFLNIEGTIKTLIMVLSNILLYRYIFNISLSKAIFLAFIYMILLIIPDVIVTIFLTKVLNLSAYYYQEFASSLLSNVIVVIIFIILIYLFREILRRIINIKIEDNIKIIIYYVLTFACISIFFYRAFSNIKLNLDFMASIFIMLTFLIILISLIKQTIDNNKLKREYDRLLEFMTTYENEIEKQRVLRHETKNEFLTIRAKICDKQEDEEIVEYIDEILKEKIKVKQEEYAKFGYLPANGVKGLCYFKVQEAEDKGLKVSLNISKRIEKSTIYNLNIKQQKEFGRILGVLLDNAIESSLESEAKQIGIEAYTNSEQEFRMIISNTFNNEVDKSKVGKERFSTKGKNRGHGLLLVRHIINENKIFELNTDIQNNVYTQNIIVKKV